LKTGEQTISGERRESSNRLDWVRPGWIGGFDCLASTRLPCGESARHHGRTGWQQRACDHDDFLRQSTRL